MSIARSELETAILFDIDGTAADNQGTAINFALRDAVKETGVAKYAYGFTTMSRDTFGIDLEAECVARAKNDGSIAYTRAEIIKLYREAGINVRAIITPMDCAEGNTLGSVYEQFAKAYEIASAMASKKIEELINAHVNDPLKLEADARAIAAQAMAELPQSIKDLLNNIEKWNHEASLLGREEGKKYGYDKLGLAGPDALTNEERQHYDTKGLMAKKFLENKPAEVGAILYFDDLDSAQKAVKLTHAAMQKDLPEDKRVHLSIPKFEYFSAKNVASYSKDKEKFIGQIHTHFIAANMPESAIKATLSRWIVDLKNMKEGYASLEKTTHTGDWEKLISEIEHIIRLPIKETAKFDAAIKAVEMAFLQEQHRYSDSILRSGEKNLTEFTVKLDEKNTAFSYPKMLRSALQAGYQLNTGYEGRASLMLNRDMIKRTKSLLQVQAETIEQKRMELNFLTNLNNSLNNEDILNQAVANRQVAKINGNPKKEDGTFVNLKDIQSIFTADGSIDEEIANAHKITLDKNRIKPESLALYGVQDADQLSLKERVILESSLFHAQATNYENAVRLLPPVDDHEASVKEKADLARLATKNVMQKMRFPHPNIGLTNAIEKATWETKLDLLILRVEEIKLAYDALGRSDHKKDLQALVDVAHKMQNSANPQEDFAMLIDKIESALKKEQHHFCHSLFGHDKNSHEFYEKLNKSPNDYHYPRLLAIVLQSANIDHPGAINPVKINLKELNSVRIKHHDVYTKMIPSLISSTESATYQDFAKILAKAGLSQTQTYRLFRGHDQLDATTAQKLWPTIHEVVIKNLLTPDKQIRMADPAESAESTVHVQIKIKDMQEAIAKIQAHHKNLNQKDTEQEAPHPDTH